ncbi:MAG: hypothetical protein HGA54_05370 [Actinobacteria bacterium]|nr:hypothetical protein [Actinomycetota bacterium]
MTLDEFKALPDPEAKAWLEAQTAAGREVAEICEELSTTRAALQGLGYTYALGQWHFMSFSDRASVVAQN